MSDPIEDYIRANRDRHSRAALTEEMEKAGYGRAAIEAAWDRLPAAPDKTATGAPMSSWNATPNVIPDAHLFPTDILVRTYKAKNQNVAAAMFQAAHRLTHLQAGPPL